MEIEILKNALYLELHKFENEPGGGGGGGDCKDSEYNLILVHYIFSIQQLWDFMYCFSMKTLSSNYNPIINKTKLLSSTLLMFHLIVATVQ